MTARLNKNLTYSCSFRLELKLEAKQFQKKNLSKAPSRKKRALKKWGEKKKNERAF